MHTKTCTEMFTAASYIIARTWKQPSPSVVMDKETVGHRTRGVMETVVARGSGGGADDQVEHRGS